MPFNVDSFITSLSTYGTLQTNKFEVDIPLPSFLTYPNDLLILRAEKVRVPGIVLDSIQTNRYGIGPKYQNITNVKFEPIAISFIETIDSTIYEIFNDWIRVGAFDFSGTSGGINTLPSFLTEYKEKYAVDLTIKIFNNNGINRQSSSTGIQPVRKIKLIEAFPISIGDNDLSWGDNNNLFKINVYFAYSYHQITTG